MQAYPKAVGPCRIAVCYRSRMEQDKATKIAVPAPNRPPLDRRAFRLGVANGILFTLADSLVDVSLVLTLLVRNLGGSSIMIGLLPALKNGGWLLPQLLVVGRIQPLARKMGMYRRAAVVRVIAWAVLVGVVFGAAQLPSPWALIAFFAAFSVFTLSGGSSSLAFQEIIAKVIPPRRRGAFFSYRLLFGGLLGFFVAAPTVRWLLAADGPLPFPLNYGVLCALSWVFVTLAMWSFALIDEPPLPGVATGASPLATLRRLPALLRHDLDFRRFVGNRLLSRFAAIAEPFYVVYALDSLRISPRFVGIYLAARILSAALSNLWWGRVGDVSGNRRLLILTNALGALVPWAVLGMPLLARGASADVLGYAFGVVFVLMGFSMDGSATASMNYLMEIAPADQRPLYLGLANTLLGLATFVPVLGGALVPLIGYEGLLLVAGVLAAATWLISLRLREPRTATTV